MSIRDVYLSENNIDFLYQDVSNQVLNKINFNLNSSSKYKNTIIGMMDKVYNNADKKTINNLSALNRYTSQKISDYFINQISKKQSLAASSFTTPMMDRPLKSFSHGNESELNNRLEIIRNERMGDNNNQVRKELPNLTPISVQDLESTKGETDKRYQELLAARGNAQPQVQTQLPPPQQSQQLQSQRNQKELKDLKKSNQSKQSPKVANADNNFNILPYTINDDFNNQLSNPGQPLYFNSDEMNNVTSEHVSSKYEDLQKTRNKEINEFLNYQQTVENKPVFNTNPNPQIQYQPNLQEQLEKHIQTAQDFNDPRIEGFQNQSTERIVNNSNYLGERSMIDQLNALRNPTDFNRTQIYTNSNQAQERNPNNLRVAVSQDHVYTPSHELVNPIYDFLIEQLKNSTRDYQDVPHYIVVSSEDRQWENDVENRYKFLVHFKPTSSQSGVGIDELYRNVVSVEVVKVIFPHDRLSVPFDNRIYLDLQSYPFLVMDIEELDGVFRGSNNTINDAFALLLFDKAYDSEVLTHDQIHRVMSTTDQIEKKFDRQFKRGFMSFCPFLFEKKKYPNTPLASLNRMTIRFYRPDGQPISLENDHLSIEQISYVDNPADIELIETPGFPLTTDGKYIEIVTGKWFSNRTYRVGDLIKIKNIKLSNHVINNDARFEQFINRPEGHIIINLELEDSGPNNNKGCIRKLYISPPGDIDYKTGTLDPGSYYEPSTTNPVLLETLENGSKGVLINSSMQVHITFKIVTREDKTISIIKPVNV